jgi:hypothetical protein
VSTKIVTVQRGRDSKLYPSPMPVPRADRVKIIARLHELCHGQGLSEREAQRQLLAEGWRRSAGSVHYDLTRRWPGCEWCQEAGMSEAERLARLAHALVHRDRLTAEAAQRVLAESYALQATASELEAALARFECPHCAGQSPDPAPQPQERPPAAVRQAPGGLTGMLSGDG